MLCGKMFMNTKAQTIRNKIIDIADDLFYQQGFNHTSFSDIAKEVGISRGNFYYHFKTKDDILAAVLEKRKTGIKEMLQEWTENISSARERLNRYANMMVGLQDELIQYGCPVGSVCSELIKLKNIHQLDATEMISLFRNWIIEQFMMLGYNKKKSDQLAMHLLTRTQGIGLMSQAFADRDYIKRETDELKQWINGL